jgi:cobalt-zinc-cadmium efflux system protein
VDTFGKSSKLRERFALTTQFTGLFIVSLLAILHPSTLALANVEHLVLDVGSVVLVEVAVSTARRLGNTSSNTYGYGRLGVLIGLTLAVSLGGVSTWLIISSISQIVHPTRILLAPLGIIALVAASSNLVTAYVLKEHNEFAHHVNYVHLLADSGGFFVTVAAIGIARVTGSNLAVPIGAILVSLLVLVAQYPILLDGLNILMEGVPGSISLTQVEALINSYPEVGETHHLHLWRLDGEMTACSAHIRVNGTVSVHEAQQLTENLRRSLRDSFDIQHCTLEIECHSCGEPAHH